MRLVLFERLDAEPGQVWINPDQVRFLKVGHVSDATMIVFNGRVPTMTVDGTPTAVADALKEQST